jgi:energy-converting hydrogenase Eha subunit A
MAQLFLFSLGLLFVALVLTALISATVMVGLGVKYPALSEEKAARISASFVPVLVVVLFLLASCLESLNNDPVSGPEVQGGFVLGIVGAGLIVFGYLVGLFSAKFVVANLKR